MAFLCRILLKSPLGGDMNSFQQLSFAVDVCDELAIFFPTLNLWEKPASIYIK